LEPGIVGIGLRQLASDIERGLVRFERLRQIVLRRQRLTD
jgi:hypothetical protein